MSFDELKNKLFRAIMLKTLEEGIKQFRTKENWRGRLIFGLGKKYEQIMPIIQARFPKERMGINDSLPDWEVKVKKGYFAHYGFFKGLFCNCACHSQKTPKGDNYQGCEQCVK